MIRKTRLLRYECHKFHALNAGGLTYDLYLETVWFGRIKRYRTVQMEVPFDADSGATRKAWDDAIAGELLIDPKTK